MSSIGAWIGNSPRCSIWPAFARLQVVEDDRAVPVDGQLWSSASGPLAAQAILDGLEAALLP